MEAGGWWRHEGDGGRRVMEARVMGEGDGGKGDGGKSDGGW